MASFTALLGSSGKGAQTLMQPETTIRVQDSILGEYFALILNAAEHLHLQSQKLSAYSIFIVESGGDRDVLFSDDRPTDSRAEPLGYRAASDTRIRADDVLSKLAQARKGSAIATLNGASVAPMRVASALFSQRYPFDLGSYRISLVREGTAMSVLLEDRSKEPGTRGSGSKLGFEVQLDPKDLRVIRSHFVR